MLGAIFSTFNFYMCLESSVLLMYFLRWKFLVFFLKPTLHIVSAIPKNFLSSLHGAYTTAL